VNDGVKALLKGSVVLAVSNITLRAMNFFLLPLYTKHLTTAQLGVSDAVTNAGSLLYTVLVLGLDAAYAAFYYDEKSQRHRDRIFSTIWFILATGGVLSLVLIIASPVISHLILGRGDYAPVIAIALVGVTLQLCALPFALDLRIRNQMMLFASVTVMAAALAIGFNVLFVVVLQWGYYSLVISSALTALTQVVAYRGLMHKGPRWRDLDFHLIPRLFRFSLPLVPLTVSTWVMQGLTLLMLVRIHSASVAGTYGIATRFSSILTTITSAVQVSYTAFAFQLVGKPEAQKTFVRVVGAYFLVLLGLCFIVIMVGPEAIHAMTTSSYWVAYQFLPGVLLGQAAASLAALFGYGINFVKKSYFSTISTVLGAACCVGLNVVLIGPFGGFGASVAFLSGYVVIAVLQAFFSHRLYPVSYPYTRMIVVFVILAALSFGSLHVPTGWRILMGVVGMALLLGVFHSSTSEMTRLVLSPLRSSRPSSSDGQSDTGEEETNQA